MKELTWHFPAELQEIPALLKEGFIIHSGGTNLLRSGVLRSSRSYNEAKEIKGIIDISGIKSLKTFKYDKDKVFLGSGLTYRDTAEKISGIQSEHILVKALSTAASNALRNRITLGGSAASFPPWSDLAGPLLALNAEVYFIAPDFPEEKTSSIDEFLRNPAVRRNILITKIGFDNVYYNSWYYREVRTRFDYPKFTITILISGKGSVKDSKDAALNGTNSDAPDPLVRIVITGVKGRFVREHAIEDNVIKMLVEGGYTEDGLKNLVNKEITAVFQKKAETSGEYLRHVASVELGRGLKELLRSLM